MNAEQKITALIPFYNEGERIIHTLRIIKSLPFFDEIICVDDGSTDGSADLVREEFGSVQLLQLSKNGGKCEAVKRGLGQVRTELIFLLDADLKDLNAEEFRQAVEKFRAQHFDMFMLCRSEAPFVVRLVRGHIIFTGLRLMYTNDLSAVFSKSLSKYELEIAINKYMIDAHKEVGWQYTNATNTYKVEKWGFWKGLQMEIIMNYNLVRHSGPLELLRQIRFFARSSKT